MKQHRIKKTSKLPKNKEQYAQTAKGEIPKGKGRNVPKAKGKRQRAKNNIKKVRKRLLKQTDIAKKRRLPQKTANETTENKKTTGKIPKDKEQFATKVKGKRQRAKNNIKKVRKSLLKHTGIAKERRLPQKDRE